MAQVRRFALSHRIAVPGLLLCVFLAIWGVKLWAIGRYGSDLPYWDQWAKEGELFYAPWFQQHAFWHNLFVPHNEHRIAPTLALNLGLVELGGDQWDARVQCAASAALHAALMVGLAWWALRRFPRRWGVACAILVAAVAAPPIAWENVLGGFQSQFYFLAIFSIVAIAQMLGAAAFSPGWFVGIGCAALACVSMGSGMLVAAPIAVVAAMRAIRREAGQRSDVRGQMSDPDHAPDRDRDRDRDRARLDSVTTLFAALLIGGIGWYYRPQAPWHEAIHAHSITESLLYAARCLSWPLYGAPWLALVFWAPWAVLGGSWVAERRASVLQTPRRQLASARQTPYKQGTPPTSNAPGFALEGGAPSPPFNRPASPSQSGADGAAPSKSTRLAADFIIAGGLWVLAQVAAVTYSRAGGSALPAPRYGDICALGLVFSFFALGWLATQARCGQPSDVGRLSCRRLFGLLRARRLQERRPTVSLLIPAAWLLAVAIALTLATRTELHTDLPQKKSDNAMYERNVQAFVLTDDFAALQRENGQLPFPFPDWLARIIRNPVLRRLLPPSVREPIPVSGFASPLGPAPVLLNRATHTVTGPGDWRSTTLPADHGWWKIETAGAVNPPGASLTLVSAATGRVLSPIAPTKPAGDSWRAAYVRAPHEPAVIVAKVTAPGQWLAFSEPIEMSSLGHAVWRLTLNAWILAMVGFAGVCAFGWSIVGNRSER